MTLYQKDILGKHIFQDAKDIGSIEKVIYNTDIGVVAGFVLNNQILIHSIDIYIDESGIFHIHDTYKINDPYLQELSTQNQHFIGKQVVDIDNKTLWICAEVVIERDTLFVTNIVVENHSLLQTIKNTINQSKIIPRNAIEEIQKKKIIVDIENKKSDKKFLPDLKTILEEWHPQYLSCENTT